MAKRFRKIVIAADSHGNLADLDALSALYEFNKSFKADERVFLGDGFDLASLRKGAMGREEDTSLYEDIKAGMDFIHRFRPSTWHMGNHEDRLYEAIEHTTNGIMRDYCMDLATRIEDALKRVKCGRILPYDSENGVASFGPIKTIHGYKTGKGAIAAQAAHYGVPGGCVVAGHEHSMIFGNVEKHGGVVGIVAACLINIEKARYARRWLSRSKWANGWVYGYYNDSDWKLWHAHRVGGIWCYTTQCTLDTK